MERRIGAGWEGAERRLRIDGREERSLSALARTLPLNILVPQSHQLLELGPEYRRRMLDWGVFHVEPAYGDLARRYFRALRQRNSALKGEVRAAWVWERTLGDLGEQVAERRDAYVRKLNLELEGLGERLCKHPVQLELRRGWGGSWSTLGEALKAFRGTDVRSRCTTAGPHRADFSVVIAGRRADRFASRGQQKMAIAAVMLAQAKMVRGCRRGAGLLLVDDIGAELDKEARKDLWDEIRGMGGQALLTVTDERDVPAEPGLKVFHVEQGLIRPA